MKNIFQKNREALLFIAVLASRLPFLGNGFGSDPDAWRIAMSGLHFLQDGVYQVSRFPGYPIAEFLNAPLVVISPSASNLMSAFLSACSALLMAQIGREISVPRPLSAALFFSFIPVVWQISTTTMDHIWALFFFLLSFSLYLRERRLLASLSMGLAFACRITYAPLALIPLLLEFGFAKSLLQKKNILYLISCAGFAVFFFSPVLFTYGSQFLTYYSGSVPWKIQLWKISVGVWGIIGLPLAGVLVWSLSRLPNSQRKWILALPIFYFLLIFLKLPEDPAYLVPALVFLTWLGFSGLPPQMPKSITQGLLLLSFLSGVLFYVHKDGFHWGGPLIWDQAEKNRQLNLVRKIESKVESKSPNSVIQVGYLLPWLEWDAEFNPYLKAQFVYDLSAEQKQFHESEGRQIYSLSELLRP